jgi:hypothetical protein
MVEKDRSAHHLTASMEEILVGMTLRAVVVAAALASSALPQAWISERTFRRRQRRSSTWG